MGTALPSHLPPGGKEEGAKGQNSRAQEKKQRSPTTWLPQIKPMAFVLILFIFSVLFLSSFHVLFFLFFCLAGESESEVEREVSEMSPRPPRRPTIKTGLAYSKQRLHLMSATQLGGGQCRVPMFAWRVWP